ncbi:MAG: hypothetical protein K2I68_03265 [Bacteroidales bacterium]|nr:hypothetical protein [Bacteroidales bacterium]MDE6107013.1 hypothetical protein [Bacteroidales bacterium]MDE6440292.1 hypothetical protein [Bacteroidales bacterium]
MGLFLPTFFKTRPRRTFEYKPRYYNEEQERLDLLKKKYAAEGAEPAGSERAEREARMRQEFEMQRPRRNAKGLLSRRGLLIAIGLVVVLLFFIL